MDLGITGRTALVLGASGGLGSAIAVRLAREGANVAVAGRSADALAATVARVEEAGARAVPLVWDLGDLDRVEPSVAEVERVLGPVDIIVNNTGGPPPTLAAGQEAAMWRTNFERMVLVVIVLTDRVLPGMRERGWGRILTSTSSGALSPIPNLGLSNTLRASLTVVEDDRRRSRAGRRDVKCHRARPDRDRQDSVPRRAQGVQRGPHRRRRDARQRGVDGAGAVRPPR